MRKHLSGLNQIYYTGNICLKEQLINVFLKYFFLYSVQNQFRFPSLLNLVLW